MFPLVRRRTLLGPNGLGSGWGAGYCLQAEESEGLCLQRRGLGEEVERCAVRVCGQPTRVTAAGGEMAEQGREALHRQPLGRLPGGLFQLHCGGGLCRSLGVPLSAERLQVFLLEQQGCPGLFQVPLHVIGQHAQQNVGPHAVVHAVVDRPRAQRTPNSSGGEAGRRERNVGRSANGGRNACFASPRHQCEHAPAQVFTRVRGVACGC
jgi:hypothetical protein